MDKGGAMGLTSRLRLEECTATVSLSILISLHKAGVMVLVFFFLNDPPTTEISPLPLHDALPISRRTRGSPASSAESRSPVPTRVITARAALRTSRRRWLVAVLLVGIGLASAWISLAVTPEIGRAHV